MMQVQIGLDVQTSAWSFILYLLLHALKIQKAKAATLISCTLQIYDTNIDDASPLKCWCQLFDEQEHRVIKRPNNLWVSASRHTEDDYK